MAGFEQARGEIVITLDADLQNPPEEIPRLVRTMAQGYDVVGSVRANRQDSLFRRAASSLINRAVQKATGVMMHDYGCMLRAYRGHIVHAMLMCHERSTFIPVLGNSFARKTAEIEVGHDARQKGDSKYSFSRLISLMFDLVTSMTTFPLRLLSVAGAIVSALGIGFGLFLLFMRLLFGAQWAARGCLYPLRHPVHVYRRPVYWHGTVWGNISDASTTTSAPGPAILSNGSSAGISVRRNSMKAVVLAYHNIGCVGIEALLKNGIEIAAVFTHRDDPNEYHLVRLGGGTGLGPGHAGLRAGRHQPSALGGEDPRAGAGHPVLVLLSQHGQEHQS